MKKLLILVKVQFRNFLFSTTQGDKRKLGKGIGGKIVVAIPFAVLVYLAITYNIMFFTIVPSNYHYLILYAMTFFAAMISFFFGITLAQGHLFTFSDFDLLMSLPIKKSHIMISKMASFYLMELLYSAFFILTSAILYGYYNPVPISFYFFCFIGIFFVPVVPIILSSIIALVIRKISGKSRFRNLISNILTVGFVVLISFGMQTMQIDISMGNYGVFSQIYEILENYLPTIYYYVASCLEADILSMLVCIAISLVAGAIYVFGFSRLFVSINSGLSEGFKVKNFKLKTAKSRNAFRTLLNKEMRKYFANFMYVLNTSIGQIMLLIFAGYLVINQGMVRSLVAELSLLGVNVNEEIFVVLIIVLVFCGHMSCPAGVSISLEGKHLWITKSSPVKTTDVFLSKIVFNVLLVAIPSLVFFLLIGFVFSFSIIQWLVGISFIVSMAFFIGLMGITVNLFLPKLDFDREIIVIKQSASSFVTVMGGILFAIALIMGYVGLSVYFIIDPLVYIVAVCGLYAISDAILWLYLRNKGAKKFGKLYN